MIAHVKHLPLLLRDGETAINRCDRLSITPEGGRHRFKGPVVDNPACPVSPGKQLSLLLHPIRSEPEGAIKAQHDADLAMARCPINRKVARKPLK